MSAPVSRYAGEFLSAFAEDCRRFSEAMAQSDQLRDFLAADHSLDEKKQLLRQVFEGTLDPFTLSLLGLLLEQGRLSRAEDIAQLSAEMLKRWRDTLTVRLSTATPLPPEEEEALRATLKARYGKEILLEKTLDETLIGGAVLRIGDKLFDGSIKSQLNALEKDLLK